MLTLTRRSSIKSAYEKKIANSQYMNKQILKHWFKVGQSYLPSTIVQKVAERTGTQPKNTQGALKVLRKYYEVTPTSIKGVKGYKIKRIL